jgi:rhodanese-related sulfurtransferase
MQTQDTRRFKNELYEQFARITKALANPHRLELVDLLAQGERTVEDLAREAALPMANASQHLQVLRAAHLVAVRRAGLYAYYRLADERVFRVWQALREVGETQLSEIALLARSLVTERSSVQAVTTTELLQRLRDGTSVVVDVRPALEYQAGHIPSARSIPLDELASRLAELPPGHAVVAYCRGPYCLLADEAVALLRHHGVDAYRFEAGLPEWRAQGLPVEADHGVAA